MVSAAFPHRTSRRGRWTRLTRTGPLAALMSRTSWSFPCEWPLQQDPCRGVVHGGSRGVSGILKDQVGRQGSRDRVAIGMEATARAQVDWGPRGSSLTRRPHRQCWDQGGLTGGRLPEPTKEMSLGSGRRLPLDGGEGCARREGVQGTAPAPCPGREVACLDGEPQAVPEHDHLGDPARAVPPRLRVAVGIRCQGRSHSVVAAGKPVSRAGTQRLAIGARLAWTFRDRGWYR